MEIFYQILTWINHLLMGLCSIAFGIQFVYTLLFFLPAKKYRPAARRHRFAVVVPARNEADVIEDTIASIRAADYPRENVDIFVFCHNCTDDTAARAVRAGARAIAIEDADPAHARKSWCLKHGFERLLAEYDDCDAFIMLDADTLVHPEFFTRMNDAYDSGVRLGRAYQSAKNLTQNVLTGVSGLWYIRDCRFACHAREKLGIGQMMVGSGMMIDRKILDEEGGWTAMGISEDAEFTIAQAYRGRKAHYVPDAIIYEDQPASVAETFKRNVRMGNGLHKLFWTQGWRCLGKFFTTLDFTFLDFFLSLLFMPIAVILCTWLPFYYGFDMIYSAAAGNAAHAAEVGRVVVWVLLFAFVVPFILQALLVVALEGRRLPVAGRSKLIPVILLFPIFMILYAAGIFAGSVSKPKWRAIRRSHTGLAELHAALGASPLQRPAAEDDPAPDATTLPLSELHAALGASPASPVVTPLPELHATEDCPAPDATARPEGPAAKDCPPPDGGDPAAASEPRP